MNSNDLCDEVLSSLKRIARAVDLQSRQLVRRFGLTGPQLYLLKALIELGETTVGQLAESVNSSKPTVTDILNRLEKQGLVTRVRSDVDKRCVYVKATRIAINKLKKTPPMLQENFVARFGGLQKWEQFQLLSSLHKVAELMDMKEMDEALAVIENQAGNNLNNTDSNQRDPLLNKTA